VGERSALLRLHVLSPFVAAYVVQQTCALADPAQAVLTFVGQVMGGVGVVGPHRNLLGKVGVCWGNSGAVERLEMLVGSRRVPNERSSGGADSEAGTARRNGERIGGNQIGHCGTSFGLGGAGHLQRRPGSVQRINGDESKGYSPPA